MASSCGSSCGWLAAAVSCVSFGSFGVPIKGDAATSVDIDALVMQSYKTIMCFLTSWIVLLLGEPFTYTPWGIVSGAFWVPSGTAAIYAIRNAGLATSQGVWSALIVLVSFTWGVFVFGEGVRSRAGAGAGVALMMVGLWGMSYHSSPGNAPRLEYRGVGELVADEGGESPSSGSSGSIEIGQEAITVDESSNGVSLDGFDRTAEPQRNAYVQFLGCAWTRRNLGLAGACFNGIWGGSIMAPMHFASENTSGLGYAISFAIGASLVCLSMWACRFLYHYYRTRSVVVAFAALPSFHLRVMWIPGGIAGTLWSLGNICSMLSVQGLGEGVGYSVVQASMLVSGLWGIFFFKEVSGTMTIIRWFLFALFTITGILLLSYEHKNG